jgi:superfamily II DNA or RNA helicase
MNAIVPILTPDQQSVADAFLGFILNTEAKEMVISGPAGSGKTFSRSTLYGLQRARNSY